MNSRIARILRDPLHGGLDRMGVRVEQQAFAKHGLNFVIEKYLPAKLRNPARFLP